MKFKLLGSNFGLGQKKPGLEMGPTFVKENGLLELIHTNCCEFTDLGNLTLNVNETSYQFLKRLKQISLSSQDENSLLVHLGGDHSLAMATVGASLETFEDLRVVWIDAHGDLNTPNSSPTGNLHGMPLAALIGLYKTQLVSKKLELKNLLMIGVRDLDPFEREIIESLKIQVLTAKDIRQFPEASLIKIKNWLIQKSSPIHVSFDIDSVDPSLAPATGLKVADGIMSLQLLNIFQIIFSSQQVKALDIVEINPQQATKKEDLDQTLAVVLNVFQTIINCKKESKFLNDAST